MRASPSLRARRSVNSTSGDRSAWTTSRCASGPAAATSPLVGPPKPSSEGNRTMPESSSSETSVETTNVRSRPRSTISRRATSAIARRPPITR
jgi:hypothetical protein